MSEVIASNIVSFCRGAVVCALVCQYLHIRASDRLREARLAELEERRGERHGHILPQPLNSTYSKEFEYGRLKGTVNGQGLELDRLAERVKALEAALKSDAA